MKRDADGQPTWREPVSAFRAVAAAFARPAPHVFSLLSEESAVAWLAAEPPLTHFSPFNSLPKDNGGGADPRPDISGRPSEPIGQTTGHPGARRTSPPVGGHEPSPPAREARQSSPMPPVFSLKALRQPDARQTAADVFPRQRRSFPLAEAKQKEGHTPRPGGTKAQRAVGVVRKLTASDLHAPAPAEGATKAEMPESLRRALNSKILEDHEGRTMSHQLSTALPLLNNLADETLRSMRSAEAEPSSAENSPATTRPSVNRQRQSQSTTPSSTARDAAPTGEDDLSSSPILRPRASFQFEDGHSAGITGSSIDAINALAELLRARSSAHASPSSAQETDATVASPSRTQFLEDLFSSHASAPAAKPGREGEVVAARAASQPSQLAEGAARHQQTLDAESVASLVNEILVEQARRHGVDLS